MGKTYPRQVRRMLINKSAPQPAMRKTPRGGKSSVMRTSRITLAVPMVGVVGEDMGKVVVVGVGKKGSRGRWEGE